MIEKINLPHSNQFWLDDIPPKDKNLHSEQRRRSGGDEIDKNSIYPNYSKPYSLGETLESRSPFDNRQALDSAIASHSFTDCLELLGFDSEAGILILNAYRQGVIA